MTLDLASPARSYVARLPLSVIFLTSFWSLTASLQVDKFVTSGMVVGLGSGPASALAIQYLGTRLRRGSLTGITAVTS